MMLCLAIGANGQTRNRLLDLAPSGAKDVQRNQQPKETSNSSNTSEASNTSETGDTGKTRRAGRAGNAAERDSAVMADLRVKQYEASNYDQLTATGSSLDLKDPDNVQSEVEYQPETGYYILHTKIGDVDIATPYLMSEQEYRSYSEKQAMQKYWQQKVGEVEHDNEKKFDITDMKFDIGPADKIFGPGGVQPNCSLASSTSSSTIRR